MRSLKSFIKVLNLLLWIALRNLLKLNSLVCVALQGSESFYSISPFKPLPIASSDDVRFHSTRQFLILDAVQRTAFQGQFP